MLTSSTHIQSDKASRYLAQLCKHFAHKVPAQWDQTWGEIEFASGQCRLESDDTTLTIVCQAADDESLKQVQGIVENHLVRFAWREDLAITWHAGAPEKVQPTR
ncbi:DUF2218 domain-containing protein [Rhodovibrio salinarum]|uniref:DUF2218 domain-containing protein n=1 Tax=Rhodovibrio salinarum TaxID=1087 RepID=A0A934QIQ6_9PROT|nr:DUF2218 domain-containing protein [Rhodovibrio salinarum]MBK1697778.1 DUF2218 domain-containing protein [Rhodovibrio salinarum]